MKFNVCITLLIFTLFSCSKDNEFRIPDVYVDYRVTLQEFQIKNVNRVLIVNNHGVSGLIIYHRPDNVYVAYDLCSSVNPEKKCAVELGGPSLTVTDPCSGAKFSLYDGTPVKAPATRPLKEYQVTVSNSVISVIN